MRLSNYIGCALAVLVVGCVGNPCKELNQSGVIQKVVDASDAAVVVERHLCDLGQNPREFEFTVWQSGMIWSVTVWAKPAVPGGFSVFEVGSDGRILEEHPGR